MTKGFTLIELIIYSAIICFFLISASTFAWQIIQGDIKTSALREVEENANFIMGKIGFTIRDSSKIVEPEKPGDQTDYLFLRRQDPAKTLTQFRISDEKIVIKEGGGDFYPLTSDLVKVTNLKFTNLSYEDTPGIIKIEMTIEYRNPGERPEYGASVNLESSVSLRY